MTAVDLRSYLERPLTPPSSDVLAALEGGPIAPADALHRTAVDRLLEPTPLTHETGWCWLADGVGYVAVRTPMPAVTGEMVDWWFDWHAEDPLRYRIWHPIAHYSNSVQRPARAHAKPHWGAVHHPVEDVGIGTAHARISFRSPTEMGMSSDALDDPDVATIVCGYAGDDQRRIQHTPMFHVFLREGGGVVLRSRFWLGAAIRPFGPLGGPGGWLLNRRSLRRRALPSGLPRALANHCAEEYANLAALLPELYGRMRS